MDAGEGVRLVSITQEMGEDPTHVMMRQIMMTQFDEYRSKENAKHVLLISAYAGTTREVAARCRLDADACPMTLGKSRFGRVKLALSSPPSSPT